MDEETGGCLSDPKERTEGGRQGKLKISMQPKESSAQPLRLWVRNSPCSCRSVSCTLETHNI